MAPSPVSSRLEALQARFQQKQMQEKEQKLLQLYDQQQHRAYQVVQRGTAASTGYVTEQRSVTKTSTTTQNSSMPPGGKVRQMFDERRHITTKGIDRSYLLDPLDNKSKKQVNARHGHVLSKTQPKSIVTQQTTTFRRTAKADINSNINGGKPIVSYQEEVSCESFENDNHDNDHNGGARSPCQNRVHIEEILNDDTIERNRMLAKIHLMEYDGNLRHRIDHDLNSEKFPDDLMVDVPDKLPNKSVTKKKSDAEARLERFKNANVKRDVMTVNRPPQTRKVSEPVLPSSRPISRASRITGKTTETEKAKRSDTKPSLSPSSTRNTDGMGRKTPIPERTKPMKPNSPTSSVQPAVTTKTVSPIRSVKSAEPELQQPIKPLMKTPNPESASKKSSNSIAKTPARRHSPPSSTENAEIVTKRGFVDTMSPEPKPVRRSPQGASRNHEATDTTDMRTASDTSNPINRTGSHQIRADDEKSSIHSPTTDDSHPDSRANEPTAIVHQVLRRSPVQRRRSTTRSPSPRPSSTLSTTSSTTSSAKGSSSPDSKFRRMATKAKNPTRSPGINSTSNTRGQASVSRNSPTVLSSDDLVSCKICGRNFAQDRISLHEKICAKTGQKKRKQFDAVLHRVQGTEFEVYTKKRTPAGKQTERGVKAKNPESKPKSNWRRKHEDFINAIRSAKQVQAHLAAGGKLSDLPPPPVSDTSDYIQCSHCGRKFNQGAAERHIPKCATMMHNKPKPRAPPKPRR